MDKKGNEMDTWTNKKLSEKEAMGLAIQLAEKGQGFVSPNPPVGCVILDKHSRFLSSGFYSHYGGIHAEISALNKIKNKKALKDARLFVTLEPCAHYGQNPPCVDRLLQYPLAEVIYGREDPNPKTKSKGLKKLKQKGLLVKKSAFYPKAIRRLYEAFALNQEESKTFFALKTASSLDGISALTQGESQWITGKETKDFVFYLRACFSAVLIGINTFLEDNPKLNCRKKEFKKVINKVCLLDPLGQSLKLIPRSALASVRPMENIFVITSSLIKQKYPFKIIQAPLWPHSKLFDLNSLSSRLYREKIPSVLIEGGVKTFSHFLQQKAVQRLYQFIHPCLLGGLKGRVWTENLSIPSLKNKIKLKETESLLFGEDFCITGVLNTPPPPPP